MGFPAKRVHELLTERIDDIVEIMVLSNVYCPIKFDPKERNGIVYERIGDRNWMCKDWKSDRYFGGIETKIVVEAVIDAVMEGVWEIIVKYYDGKQTRIVGDWGPCELCWRRRDCEFWIE